MTSRERVIATLNYEEPDRVPIDFASNYCTSVNVIAYNRLKRHLGVTSPTYMRYVMPMLAAPDLDENLDLFRKMGSDIFPLPRYWADGMPAADWKPWTLKDGSECMVPGRFNPVRKENGDYEITDKQGVPVVRMPKNGHYFDRVHIPLASIDTLDQLEQAAPSLKNLTFFRIEDEELDILEDWARRAYEETEYAIMGDTYTFSVYQVGHELFGYNKFFMFMASNPEIIHRWQHLLVEGYSDFLTKYLSRVGKYIVAVIIGDDLGSQKSPQISVDMFRELFKPYFTQICDLVHKLCPHVKVLLHCCGSVMPLIPEFIECGIDALNPVQTSAANMDPTVLKREFGKDIVFWGGGISTQTTLCHGSVEDVRDEVKERIGIFKPGGGYIFTVEHDIQEHVPPEKIMAVFETAQECGEY